MSDLEITLKLPENVIQRARALGIDVEGQADQFTAVLEKEIRLKEAGQRMRDLVAEIDALPDDIKPTPEEIDAEIRAYRAEKRARNRRQDP